MSYSVAKSLKTGKNSQLLLIILCKVAENILWKIISVPSQEKLGKSREVKDFFLKIGKIFTFKGDLKVL